MVNGGGIKMINRLLYLLLFLVLLSGCGMTAVQKQQVAQFGRATEAMGTVAETELVQIRQEIVQMNTENLILDSKIRSQMINIGLTFYGGVSLAVYEAGVAETFIRFIQFCKKGGEEGKPAAGIPEVDISVISGSSAGGLAAVLMSATLVNSSDPTRHIQEIRRIWFDVADMDTLQYKGGQDVSSFLNNDVLESEVRKFLSLQDGTQGSMR